jgi:uncharacterized protein with NRDE domain
VCTVVISLAPADPMPLLLMGFRDEFTGRPWQPPARHWPGSPLIGGRDEQAGGTWLAVHPAVPRVSCILNARGPQAPADRRRSRGELPLRAADQGHEALRELHKDPAALASYDPFFLVCADLSSALLLSWDGRNADLEDLQQATHLLTNAGHLYPRTAAQKPAAQEAAAQEPAAQEPAAQEAAVQEAAGQETAAQTPPEGMPDPWAKAARFGPKFAAHRPSGDPAATIEDAWGDWLTLGRGDGLTDADAAAIVVRRELPDGRVWGTTSVSLVALGPGRLRYDFQPVPADPATWYAVNTG